MYTISNYAHTYNREINVAKHMGIWCNSSNISACLKYLKWKLGGRNNPQKKNFVFFTLKSLISEYFVCLVPSAIYKYNFFQCCVLALAVIRILFFSFLAFNKWLVGVIIFDFNIILNPFLQMKRNIFYWDRLRSRKNKCNLKQRNLS